LDKGSSLALEGSKKATRLKERAGQEGVIGGRFPETEIGGRKGNWSLEKKRDTFLATWEDGV